MQQKKRYFFRRALYTLSINYDEGCEAFWDAFYNPSLGYTALNRQDPVLYKALHTLSIDGGGKDFVRVPPEVLKQLHNYLSRLPEWHLSPLRISPLFEPEEKWRADFLAKALRG